MMMFHRLSSSSSTIVFATLLLASGTTGFTLPTTPTPSIRISAAGYRLAATNPFEKNTFIDAIVDGDASTTSSFDPLNLSSEEASSRIIASNVSNNHERNNHSAAVSSILAASILMSSTPLAAHAAAGPDWGIFEGRTGSLLHPIAMFSMAALSASTARLGFQWRRQRTLGDEIAALKKTLPVLKDGATSVKEALAAATSMDEVDASYVSALKGALETENQIAELTKERKDLANASPRDKHFNQGSLILFLGIAFAIEGPLNTYARAGKLFPGPHLYAGAGLVVLWALAASMVPSMQKGNDTARAVHIGANVAGLGLLAWQVTTGVPILLKVIELTKWP